MPGVSITADPDTADVHPSEFVTAKAYDPGLSPDIDVVDPLPVDVIPPGDPFTVHDPLAGNPVSEMVPVETRQVGCVMVLTTGAVGVEGWTFINMLLLKTEVQDEALETV